MLGFWKQICHFLCEIYQLKTHVKETTFFKNPSNSSWINLFLTTCKTVFRNQLLLKLVCPNLVSIKLYKGA